MPHSLDVIEQIKKKHRLTGEPFLLPFSGMVNEAWQIGDEYILRINRREDCDNEAAREELVVPLVHAAGLRTPELIACSYEADIVPRPYTIYRRARGVLLGSLDIDPSVPQDLYREIGRQLALLHRMEPPDIPVAPLSGWEALNPRTQLERARNEEVLEGVEVEEIGAWLDLVEPSLGELQTDRLIHKDMHPWNLLVDPETFELTAIIDWGDASLGDVAIEFAAMPLVAVPAMIEGYRIAGEEFGLELGMKAAYVGLGIAIWEMRKGDPATYRRQWWRMPQGGWPVYKAAVDTTRLWCRQF